MFPVKVQFLLAASKINHDGPTDYPRNKMPQQRLSTLPSENYKPIPPRKNVPFSAAMVGTGKVSNLSIADGKPFIVFSFSSAVHVPRNSRSMPFEQNFPSPVVIRNWTSLFLKKKAKYMRSFFKHLVSHTGILWASSCSSPTNF